MTSINVGVLIPICNLSPFVVKSMVACRACSHGSVN